MSTLTLSNLTVRRQGCPVVDNVSITVQPGELVGLIGPNGAGKTTLMRAALGLLPFEGRASLAELPSRERAKTAAWMPQIREIAWPVTVETLVSLGRTPYLAGGRRLSVEDRRVVTAAMQRMGLLPLAERTATELSGGEQARALIARALAQNTPLILADEPVAGLDPAHQIATMKTFRALAAEQHGVLVSLHELGLAARYCTSLAVMHGGKLVAHGAPEEVLNAHTVRSVFGVEGRWSSDPDGRTFHVVEEAGA